MSELVISQLIGRIYSSVQESANWRAILEEVRLALDAHLIFAGRIDTKITSPEYSELIGPERSSLGDAEKLHREELYQIDPGFRYVLQHPEGGNFRFLEHEAMAGRSEWTGFINGELGSVDYHSRYSPLMDGLNFCLAVHNDEERGAVTERQRELHRLVYAHMSNAVRLNSRPEFLLDEKTAAMLVDDRHIVQVATTRAEEIFRIADGLSYFNRIFKCCDHNANARLTVAITRALAAEREGSYGGGLIVERPSGNLPYIVTVSPVLQSFAIPELSGPLARIEIIDQSQQGARLQGNRLIEMFGLTPREADVAARFSGRLQNLREISEELGMSHETARVHLRNILAKCRVTNQLELVQLLARIF